MHSTTEAISVGDRVVIAKQKATVRYVGPVDGQEGIWVGVEWDDSSRGKHDGSTGGRRYFCCSTAPTAGSFVRINKVIAGHSLVDALVLRYTNQLAEGQSSTADSQHAYVSTASNKKLWVELVGQEQVTARQSKLELLTSARLVGANVSSVVSNLHPTHAAGCPCWHLP
jgi:dynactin complex subunit